MKKLIEGIKANKGTIVKRGLIVIGAVIGLGIIRSLTKEQTYEEDYSDEIFDAGENGGSINEITEE